MRAYTRSAYGSPDDLRLEELPTPQPTGDEVLVEVPEDECDAVGPLVIELMRGAASLDVPLEVNVAWGDTWAAAKS